ARAGADGALRERGRWLPGPVREQVEAHRGTPLRQGGSRGVEQVGPADPPLAVHRVYGDRHRQLRRPGTGRWDASALGDLLAAAPARLAPAHRSVPVRAAVCHQVAPREGRKATQGEAVSIKKRRRRRLNPLVLPDTIVQWTRRSPAGIIAVVYLFV